MEAAACRGPVPRPGLPRPARPQAHQPAAPPPAALAEPLAGSESAPVAVAVAAVSQPEPVQAPALPQAALPALTWSARRGDEHPCGQ